MHIVRDFALSLSAMVLGAILVTALDSLRDASGIIQAVCITLCALLLAWAIVGIAAVICGARSDRRQMRIARSVEQLIDAEDLRAASGGCVRLLPLLVGEAVEEDEEIPASARGFVRRFGELLPWEARLLRAEWDWTRDGRGMLHARYIVLPRGGERESLEYLQGGGTDEEDCH